MRRRRFTPGPSLSRTARKLGPVVTLAALASCTEIDTTRVQPFTATLGDDLYGVLCDRLGASSFAEDTSGRSFQGICHPTADGKYENEVDESVLPPVPGDAGREEARALSIAKLRAMARWRGDLVRALNATFPDVEIDDVTTEADGDKVRLHDGLMKLGQSLTPLYETNPYDKGEGAEPLFPMSTRALARVLDSIVKDDAARAAFSRLWGRQSYRPFKVGLGAVTPALGYPQLRSFTKASLAVLGPEGSGAAQLQQLFAAGKRELRTAKPEISPLAPYRIINDLTAQPERPRTTLEFTAELMLAQDDAYGDGGASRFIAMRDRRGFVVPLGNAPGVAGTVTSPFADSDNDGFADVDPFGRFIGAGGQPVKLDLPFLPPNDPVDPGGMPSTPVYHYLDTSKTPIAAVARSLRTLADPQNGALMDALAGAHLLFGPRVPARYDYSRDPKDAILEDGEQCPTQPADACFNYTRFKGEDSPLVDLIHAVGPVLADPDSDALLLGLLDLIENHESDVARLLGAALKVRQIALDHDKLAQQGKEPLAAMPYATPIWDEMGEVLAKIVEEPRLIQKIVKGFSDPVLLSPQGGSPNIGETLATFLLNRDEMTYDPNNINGPGINLTANAAGGSTEDPKFPVDQTTPKTGKNRSLFERTLGLIHDVNGVHMCNKQGAKVYAPLVPGDFVPFIDGDECKLVEFPNLAGLYLDALLPDDHPKRAKMELANDTLQSLIDTAKSLGINIDQLFEDSSGITGMTLTPTLPALNRLVFFGADSGLYQMPDLDPFRAAKNKDPNLFISSLLEPSPTSSCPKKANGANECADASDTLRVRGQNTIFAWERFGFYAYLRPVVTPFAEVGCSEDVTICPKSDINAYYRGEQYFVDLIDILHRRWSKDGGNTYETILADSFRTDLIPALVQFSKVATDVNNHITAARGPGAGKPWTGADVLAKTAKILFSTDYAASIGLTDRKGNKGTKWTDGTPQSQVTVYSLFADALHAMDVRFDTACDGAADPAACQADAADRKARWKAARSRLVDELLSVDGDGPGAAFRNKATPKLLARTLRLLREQVNAHCPDREGGGGCDWARKELADSFERTVSGPMFAALMDVQEALRADEPARTATELLLIHLLTSAGDGESFQATLASFADLLQVLQGDADISPILRAAAPALGAADDPEGRGAADAMIRVLLALTDDKHDPYHVMDHVLRAAVTPMDDGADRAPLEIFIDAASDIHRIDSESSAPLDPADYAAVFNGVGQFLTSEKRGLEQFYYIVQNRPRQ